MPQTLEEFVRGTPFARELERLQGIERSAQALVTWIDADLFSDDPGAMRRFESLRLALSAKAVR